MRSRCNHQGVGVVGQCWSLCRKIDFSDRTILDVGAISNGEITLCANAVCNEVPFICEILHPEEF